MDDVFLSLATANNGSAEVVENEREFCDDEAWKTLTRSLHEVQSVLDHNRLLIQQVNENQYSMMPSNLVKNEELIREINVNISKVVGIYSNLSTDFSGKVRQLRSAAEGAGKRTQY